MKKLIALALAAMSFLSFVPAASAQPFGTWAYCNGIYRFGNCGGPTMQQYQQQYRPQFYGNQPQYVQPPQYYGNQQGYANNGFSNCTVIGGVIGGIDGNRIDHHGVGGTVAGALLGGAIGNLVCNNSQGQRVTVQRPQGQYPQLPQMVQQPQYREEFSNPPRYPDDITGQQQIGSMGGYQQRPRTRHYPADCDIGGHPELQDLDVPPAKCEAIRNALREKKPGHCIIGGTSYPEFVDNESGCRAKWKELAVNRPTQKVADASVPVAYCTIYGPAGAMKKVVNRERRNEYCGEVIRDLQTHKVSWENLETIN
jgi:hypothetical protein